MNIDHNIFKNNMEALQKNYPDLALRLSTVKIENIKLVKEGNNLPNLIINNRLYYIGNIKDYVEEQLKGFELNNVKVPVFLGMGLGYEIMYWMQFKSKEYGSQAIIIFERNPEIFMAAMNVIDITPIINNPNIHLFVGISIENLYVILREHFKNHIQEMLMSGATQPIFLYTNMNLYKEYYLQVLHVFFESLYHSIQNFGNSAEDSLIGLENMLDNVNEIVNNPGINLLYEKFKGKPAIIVATGPSLKKNLHLLKGLEDKALMISVDASFKLLMKNGIKPHMVTSLEREHEVQQFFDNFDKEDVKDVYMTACPVLFNHVYESYNGPQLIVYRNFDHFKWLEIDRGILDIKLSSSNMAFKVAEALGCDPIILVGQDLAYGENDETHATEVPFTSEGEGIFYVKGNIEEKVKTNSGWYNFLKAFEFDIAQFNGLLGNNANIYNIPKPILFAMKDNISTDQNIAEETKKILLAKIEAYLFEANANNKKVINATEGGAYIQGTEIATLEETLKKYITEKFDPLTIIKDTLKQFTSENVENDIEKLRLIIEKTENEVQEIINNCIKGVDICKTHEYELKSDLTNDRLNEIRTEIIAPRLEIQTKYGDSFQRFLMHVVQSTHLKFEMETVMLYTKPNEVLLKFPEWYSFIGDISEICLESLKKAKKKLYAV
ncbi:MAG: motility associated factor glycosyltransferase family protein [Promethearchaeota archaeon]